MKITPELFMCVSRTRWIMIYSNCKTLLLMIPRYRVLNTVTELETYTHIEGPVRGVCSSNDVTQERFAGYISPVTTNIRGHTVFNLNYIGNYGVRLKNFIIRLIQIWHK